MFKLIFGAILGAVGYWAYQRYVIGTDDDAFADFETSSLDQPSDVSSRPAESSGTGATSSTS